MRYAQGGGLSDERRQFREGVRLRAAERFAAGEPSSVIAKELRVSVRSVQRWRRSWDRGGPRALRSAGSASPPRLSEVQFAQLEAELARGLVAHGWPDQRWTLSRVKTVIGRRFHKSYTLQGVRKLLIRHGFSRQVPVRRAVERDDEAIRLGEGDLAAGGRTAAALDAWIVFEDESGFSMTPPIARTWARRGCTPVIRVRGRSRRRISIAALTCYKPGERSRLIYRPRRDDGRRDGRKSFAWTDYRDLLITAHHQLGGPIVLVWDNLNVHLAAGMRQFIARQDWLTVYQLPSYAPDLNPVEGIWSLLRRGWLSNTAFTTPEHLSQTIRHGMRKIQYRPHLIDGCLAGTGLSLTPATS
ncbi:IS630 family transposase [Streptomyces phaeochromogenes]|uniref:IS630 family transposase n=1 Tax=Streptomyces phaeochromogenes TaxID=1923 RepID=UPI003F4D391F